MVRVDPWVKWRNLEIFKIWEGVSGAEPPLFPLLQWEYLDGVYETFGAGVRRYPARRNRTGILGGA